MNERIQRTGRGTKNDDIGTCLKAVTHIHKYGNSFDCNCWSSIEMLIYYKFYYLFLDQNDKIIVK